MTQSILAVRGLAVTAPSDSGRRTLVSDVDLQLAPGESLAIVGESGSGKSLTARSIIGLLPSGLEATGDITVNGAQVSAASATAMRGSTVALLMQDPFTMLNPLRRVGAQLADAFDRDVRRDRTRRQTEITRRLAEVGLDAAVANQFPFQLSGGMRQRVGIAAALVRDPALLVADEPTTALDVTTQREILLLIRRIQRDRSMAFVLITHDLRVAFSMCERVAVMYAGRIVESGVSADVLHSPRHPYTSALLASEPSVDVRRAELSTIAGAVPAHDSVVDECAFAARCQFVTTECTAGRPALVTLLPGRATACVRASQLDLHVSSAAAAAPVVSVPDVHTVVLKVDGMSKTFHGAARPAVGAVSLQICRGETVGLVGESGSGKTTLARCIVGLETPDAGQITIGDTTMTSWNALSRMQTSQLRGSVQMVFQDPYSSLNAMRTIGMTLHETLQAMGRPAGKPDVAELLELVGLPAEYASRRPAALSGGQRQRVAIARALAAQPQLLVCDESVSALDVSVQAQILELLSRLTTELDMAVLFVTHDLAVVRQVTSRVYVLQSGQCVESGTTDQVLNAPQHPYTRSLIASVPREDGSWLAEVDA